MYLKIWVKKKVEKEGFKDFDHVKTEMYLSPSVY